MCFVKLVDRVSSLACLQSQFVKFGGVLRDGEQVERVVSDGDAVTVTTSKSIHKARNVILAAGPWTSKLTEPLGLSLPLEVYAIRLLHTGLWNSINVLGDADNVNSSAPQLQEREVGAEFTKGHTGPQTTNRLETVRL